MGKQKSERRQKTFLASGRWGQTGNKNLGELSLSKSGDSDFSNIQDRGREFDIGRIFLKSWPVKSTLANIMRGTTSTPIWRNAR
jgi:hypothetical protein